jgi:hypothetical protein
VHVGADVDSVVAAYFDCNKRIYKRHGIKKKAILKHNNVT